MPSLSFDTSASDRGLGVSADEGQDAASSHFRFEWPPAAATRHASSAEEYNPALELQGGHRVAFGRWGGAGGGVELQQEHQEARDEEIAFEVIGGW